jgi:hypothetical protein
MKKIEEFTICLHCGCSKEVVDNQMRLLKPLENDFTIHWNNRIDRHPDSYDSFSELINDCIVTSPTEYIIFINDRTIPKPEEVKHIIELLESGYAAATKYSVGFMGFSKELIRVIGWWDERFYGGGFEDDDFVLRLRLNNLAYYESLEGTYEMHWKSPLQPEDGRSCIKSEPFFNKKWESSTNELKKILSEEIYTKYDGKIGDKREDISSNWKQWEESKIGVFFPERKITNFAGPSRTFHFRDELGNEFKKVTSI